MKESEVRAKLKELKGDLVQIELDQKTGKVAHCEIHRDSRLIWKWPPNSRARITKQPWTNYGPDWKLSLKRPDYDMLAMEKMREV